MFGCERRTGTFDMVGHLECENVRRPLLESLSKRTKCDDEDVLNIFCSSAHYLAHTVFRVSDDCSTKTSFMSSCL